jgi:hypothetical protein
MIRKESSRTPQPERGRSEEFDKRGLQTNFASIIKRGKSAGW